MAKTKATVIKETLKLIEQREKIEIEILQKLGEMKTVLKNELRKVS